MTCTGRTDMIKQYDLAFSLGRACSCSETLREARLQHLSFPWDWIGAERSLVPDLKLRTDSICNGTFHSWFTPDDLEFVAEHEWHSKAVYTSRSTGLLYNHDFPKGVPLAESFPAVKAKYDRRFARLMELIGRSSKILLVRIDPPNGLKPTSVEDCLSARREFARRFPHAQFDFIMMSFEKGRPVEKRTVETPEDGFTHISFDYKDYSPGKPNYAVLLDQTAAVLREMVSVRDYRTKDEIAAFRKRVHLSKMRQVGAKNELQFFLARHKEDFIRIARAFSPRMLMARLRTKKFDHVFPIGVNCEAGFRFFCKWGFVDSSPFTWAQTYNITRLTHSLQHMDEIGSQGFEWDPKLNLWNCRKTGLVFHGRMKVKNGQPPPDQAALDADSAELQARLTHLKKKLLEAISDDSRTLLACRVNPAEVLAGGIGPKLDGLQAAINEMGAKNCQLLVVVERRMRHLVPSAEGRFVRSVKAFNPGDAVTVRTKGDPIGWDAVFTEFAPAVIKKATHKFKFE